MDISTMDPGPSLGTNALIFGFCAVIAVLLIWRMFRKPDTPGWGRRGRRE